MKRKNKCANKKPLPTISLANKLIKKIYLNDNIKLRFYECPTCLDFHLTHKNIDDNYFRAIDREIIKKQWGQFEVLFNTFVAKLNPSTKTLKNRRKRAARSARQAAKEQQEREADMNKKLSKKLEKQLSLQDAKLAILSFKCLNGIVLLKITCILSTIDYSVWVWKNLKRLS